MPTYTISMSQANVVKEGIDYPTQHAALIGDILHNSFWLNNFWAGHRYASPTIVDIIRAGLSGQLSSIPSTERIVSASLSFWFQQAIVKLHPTIALIIVDGDNISMPMVLADYGTLLSSTTSFGSISSDDITLYTWETITLNSLGLAKVKTAHQGNGTVKFGARIDMEINSDMPPGSAFQGDTLVSFVPTLLTVETTKKIWLGDIHIDQLIYQHCERMVR